MRLRTIFVGLIIILLLILAGIVVVLLSETVVGGEQQSSPTSFSVLETGAASSFAYGVYNYRGDGNLTVLSYDREPKHKIVIINDSQAVQATRFPELVDRIDALERYGFDVSVSDEPKIADAIYVIPTGAIPSYALFNLQQNSSNATLIYIGGKDLLLSSGIKRLNWYDSLSAAQKARVVQYNGTLDDFLDGNVSLPQEILRSSWMVRNSTTYSVTGDGLRSVVVPFNGTGYMRIIYEFRDLYGIYDSPRLQSLGQPLEPNPPVIFPWEKSSLQYTLNKTNGTAFLSVRKDGKVIEHEQLRRVTDENVFFKKFEYSEPGEYILLVDDNTGIIASGLLHVKDTQIKLIEKRGYTCVFSVMVDGKPLDNSEANVSLGNSSKRKYFISDGQMVVNAKLDRGENVFNIELGGAVIPVKYNNEEDPLIEFYLKYGVPAFAIVAVVYFGARISRRPTYRLRFGDSADYVRQEMSLPTGRALESFAMIRKDMKLGKSPITPHEFSVSLKRYLTNGADVTEGNVEEILKKLVGAGHLETHRDYYQMKGEGDVVRNVLRRIVREKLIESGTPFREDGDKFVTKDFEIGFFGERFAGKGVIVVDDKVEEKRILEGMSESERARFRIQQSNGMISFVPIDRLSDVL